MFVALLVVVFWFGLWPGPAPRTLTFSLAWGAVGVFGAALFASDATSRWYKRRFGVVEKSARSRSAPRVQRWTVLSRVVLAAAMLLVWEHAHGGTLMLMATATGLFPRCYEPVPAVGIIRLRRNLYVAALGLQFALLAAAFAFHLDFHRDFGSILAGGVGSYLVLGLYDHWLLTHLLRAGHSGSSALEPTDE
jgi:hypothetical protein